METHWHQKARIRWLNEGDRKTSFFHASVKSRGVVNRVNKIFSDGSSVEDSNQIQLLAVRYYSLVAQSPSSDPEASLFQIDSNKVFTKQNAQLSKFPDADEIKNAVFALRKDNATGPDGFSGSFFTATWHITGAKVVKTVQHLFSTSKHYKASSAYFITLIPKIQSPSSFDDYRPISLLNFLIFCQIHELDSGVVELQTADLGKYLLVIKFAHREFEEAVIQPSIRKEALFCSWMSPMPRPPSLVGRQTTSQQMWFLLEREVSADQRKFFIKRSMCFVTDLGIGKTIAM